VKGKHMEDEKLLEYMNRVREMYLGGKKIVGHLDLMVEFDINVAEAIEIMDHLKKMGYIIEAEE